ncbi:MAG: NIPSNAP family protein [Pseudomonadota bacterium]
MSFYELRLYSVESGRMPEMLARLHGPLKQLFARHGVTVIDHGVATAGPSCPTFVYLMKWPSWQEREAAWAGFYADPEWHRVRAETNRGSELVERFELHLLRESVGWHTPGPETTCYELLVSQCKIGASGAAHHMVREQLPTRLAERGAVLLGAFEFITGVDLPRFAFWLGWKDRAERDAGIDLLAINPLGRSQRWLLERVSLTTASVISSSTSIKETNS